MRSKTGDHKGRLVANVIKLAEPAKWSTPPQVAGSSFLRVLGYVRPCESMRCRRTASIVMPWQIITLGQVCGPDP